MTVSRLRPLALAAFAFAVIGCDQGRQNPADTTVRVVNVAPGFPGLTFARGPIDTQRQDLGFKGGAGMVFDADTYNFRVYVREIAVNGSVSGNAEKRSITKEVAANRQYTFVLAQSGTAVQELILETEPPAATATDAQVAAANAAEGLPAMDIFLERPGTDIAGAIPWGGIGFLAELPARNVAAGDYELTVTEAGNRANVLLTSVTFTLAAASSSVFVITPEGNEGIAPVSITVASSSFGSLSDRNSPAAVRVIHAATDAAPRDVAFNGQFSPPLFSAVPFAAPTAYAQITPGTDIPVNVTPAGNPGVLELDQKVTPFATRRHTLMFSGDAGVLTHAFVTDDGRRILNEAQLTFYNAAKQFTALDLVLLPASATVDPAAVLPASTVGTGTIAAPISRPPETYNAYLLQTGTTTIVAGPITLALAAEGIYGVLATNGPSTSTATVTLIDDFQ